MELEVMCGADAEEPSNDGTSVIKSLWMNSLLYSLRFKDPLQGCPCCCSTAAPCVPLRMASSGAIALWCQTVMSRVQGNTINTMARISLLFGISRIGCLAWHYLRTSQTDGELRPHPPTWNCSPATGTRRSFPRRFEEHSWSRKATKIPGASEWLPVKPI